MNKLEIIVEYSDRIDKYLSAKMEVSRNQVEKLIKTESIKVNNKTIKKGGVKVEIDDIIVVDFPEVQTSEAKEIDFDVDIIYEDDDLLIINKPSNLTVHPAPSVKEPTLVDWLKHKNISLSTISGEERHGIVHRLDKDTTGAMVIAKNNEAHTYLAKQLEDRSMGRYYLAITDLPLKDNMIINKSIGRNPKDRLKMAVVDGAKEAKSAFLKILPSLDDRKEIVGAKLFTGRTHQIRVHLAHINRHILGDSLYGFKSQKDNISRVFLHSYILYLYHPKTEEKLFFIAPIKSDMREYIDKNFNKEVIDEKINPDTIISSFGSFI
jgi:23S rRNA pseudouridine1911/1915/1917 synthase